MATGSTAMAEAKAGKKAKKPEVVLGIVKSIDASSITVEAKSGGSKQFQLTGDTAYKVKGKKGAADTAGTRTDVKEGERVAISAKGEQAQSVLIEGKQKKGKKNA